MGANGTFPETERAGRWKTAPLAGLWGEECWEIKSLAATQTPRWECCYHGDHDIFPAPSPEWGQNRSTDEETKALRGSLPRSPEAEGEAGMLSPVPLRPPASGAQLPPPPPSHTHRASGQYSGWGRRRPWARK